MRVPRDEVRQRLRRLRRALRRERLGGVLVTSDEDVHYLSGFTGSDSSLLITGRRQWLITDSRYTEEAEATAPGFDLVQWKGDPARFAGDLARRARVKHLGFSALALSVAAHRSLRSAARGVRLCRADQLVSDLRICKSPWEVRRIRRALTCAQQAFSAVRKRIRPGMTEVDLRLDLEWEMRRRGADGTAFETIVAARANASRPHAHAGQRKLTKGALVLIDFGARVDRYNCDLTRVLLLDSMPQFWKSRYALVLEAQRAGLDAVRPGQPAAEADAAARAVFEKAGCAERFSHSLGHGVGLAVHEPPRLSRTNRESLESGMVVTVEPGLYYPRRGGIRIEDMVLVTPTGRRRLSSLPRAPEDVVL